MISIERVQVGDEPDAWRAAGFDVDDGCLAVGAIRLVCTGQHDGTSWTLRDLDSTVDDVDGIRTAVTDLQRPEPVTHPNGVTGVDHLVIGSPDLDRTTQAFERLGVECRRIRDAGSPERPMQQRFFRLGPVILEVVGAPEPTGDGPASIWGFAFTVDDLDASVDALGPACGRAKDAVQPGRRIATVRTRDLGISTPIALMSG
ncbi:MAG: hypothetical protein U5K30_08660 [Acidimicrobiales bacterium]|nr:hypothetical protein [Acidimicrobiales bacterium]